MTSGENGSSGRLKDFIHVYSTGARSKNTRGDKFFIITNVFLL